MNVKVIKHPKSTIQLDIVIPNAQVKEAYDKVFAEVVGQAEIKGFRKGQAPTNLVKEQSDESKVYSEVINHLLQIYYPQALKENHIRPVSNPRVEIKEFDLNKDFTFIATVAVQPEVKLGDYKSHIEKAFKAKQDGLKKQNAERLKNGEPLTHDHVHLRPEDVITALTETSEISLPPMMIEEETDRMLSRLVNQAQSIGLSLEQYLKSVNKTADQLKQDYTKIAENNIKAEFALTQVVESLNITIPDADIEEAIRASGDPQAQAAINDPAQRLYVQSILAKNKAIAEIIKEVEGDNFHPEHVQEATPDPTQEEATE